MEKKKNQTILLFYQSKMKQNERSTHFEDLISRDFAINGRAVTLETVNKFSLSSSSISLLGSGKAAIVLVEKFCCDSSASDIGRRGDSLSHVSFSGAFTIFLMPAISVSGTGGAEWMENNEPAALYSVNSVL